MNDNTDTDRTISTAFQELAEAGPRPPQDAQQQIDNRVRRRRRNAHSTTIAVTAVAVAAVATASIAVLGGNHSPSKVQPANTSDWQDLEGQELADALGIVPVARDQINDTARCQAPQASAVVVFDTTAYCYNASDYGIINPVEAQILTYQLRGFPRSPDIRILATADVQLNDLVKAIGKDTPTPDQTERLQALMATIKEYRARAGVPE